MLKKQYLIVGAVIVVIIAVLAWAFIESTKPLPGEVTEGELDRTHIPQGTKTSYNTNPPTGGAHYANWITKGFYDEPRMDGNLVHSLEHGYIIFSYDCDKFLNKQTEKTEIEKIASMSAESSVSFWAGFKEGGSEGTASATLAQLPESFGNEQCADFKNQLKATLDENGNRKLIATPRVGMDSPLVLTAWGRMLKLSSLDKDQIKNFISYFRDNGPERTMEN